MDPAIAVVVLVVLVALGAVAVAAYASSVRARTRAPGDDSAGAVARVALEASRVEAAEVVARARTEALVAREAALDELGARQGALEATEARLAERQRELNERRRLGDLRREQLDAVRESAEQVRAEATAARQQARRRLEERADLDRDAAAAAVLGRLDQDLSGDHPSRVARAVSGRIGDLGPAADVLMTSAIQRQGASHADLAPRTAPLLLEGLPEAQRERLLTALAVVSEDTATELGVDVERNQATLRGLDPVGREVARQASLEVLDRRLSADQVPPLLLRTRGALRSAITDLGERALWAMGIEGRPELAELLGTLHYRFSYGQNALLHCEETGHLSAALAAELRMDPVEARRAGLFHDIGKAVDHDVEGSHAIIGGELLTVLGVEAGIVHAVKAHHFDEEPATDLAMLTICADAISASRPGARRDTLSTYLQRLEQLQQIATRHRGVERAFPMQAGREVRVSVRPEQVGDMQVPELCAEIAREIESEMTYPGMIKVTVIRETSASATAS